MVEVREMSLTKIAKLFARGLPRCAAKATNFSEVESAYRWYLALGEIDEYWLAIEDIDSQS